MSYHIVSYRIVSYRTVETYRIVSNIVLSKPKRMYSTFCCFSLRASWLRSLSTKCFMVLLGARWAASFAVSSSSFNTSIYSSKCNKKQIQASKNQPTSEQVKTSIFRPKCNREKSKLVEIYLPDWFSLVKTK